MSSSHAEVQVKNLHKRFGTIHAVNGISFDVHQGEVLGFLGPNGAGKTTTMRMITGLLSPSAGSAAIGGVDVANEPVTAKKRLGYLPENAPAYSTMTVRAFLLFVAALRGFASAQAIRHVDAIIQRCRLETVATQTINTLSKGFRQRTGFAQAILHDPPVLIMDEPTDGLDPNQKQIVRDMIKDMAPRKAIIVSTHILEEVDAVCTRAIIIANGKIVANGSPDELKAMSPHGRLDDVFRKLTLETPA